MIDLTALAQSSGYAAKVHTGDCPNVLLRIDQKFLCDHEGLVRIDMYKCLGCQAKKRQNSSTHLRVFLRRVMLEW